MPQDRKKVAIGIGVAAGIGTLIFFATRAKAAPPIPPGEYCCPYVVAHGCFATYEELVTHVLSVHPGERIPLPIEWE